MLHYCHIPSGCGEKAGQQKGSVLMKRIIWCLVGMLVVLSGAMPVSALAQETGVPVGGISIFKTDVAGKPLERASFQIVRELQEGELTDRRIEKKLLKIGEENRIMAVATFWTDRVMEGQRVREVVTDETGRATIFGLTYGTYYLVETNAPEGYNRITAPIRVTVHKYSHLTQADQVRDDQNVVIDNTLHIVNIRYKLPDTGSLETLQLAAGGTGILFSCVALLLLMNRRRW